MKAVVNLASRGLFLLALPFLYLVEPFWRLRFGAMLEDRIGHIASNTLVFAKTLQLDGRPARTTWIFFGWNPANRTLFDMWKRQLHIVESRAAKRCFIAVEPLLRRTRFFQPMPFENTEHRQFALGRPPLQFTPEENTRAYAALAEMGIKPDDWFVCINSRDPAYLGQRQGFGATPTQAPASIRDCAIDTFLDAAREVSAQGGFVLRMGAVVDKPLADLGDVRIIDYATRHRSDFMDIWLSAHCRFFLGCTAGLVCVPWVFHRPVGGSNFVTLQFAALGGPRTYFMPKLLRRRQDGRIISFPEAQAMGLFAWGNYSTTKHQAYYDHLGLEWVDNTSDEIRDLCLDMLDMTEGRGPGAEAVELQDIYHGFFAGGPHHSSHAGRLAPRFAARHAALIRGDK